MAPTYCKDCSKKISGFFKKKFTCQYCSNQFCDKCFSKVKENADELSINLSEMTGQNCLSCVVLHCSQIRRGHLFLLENKQLASYLTDRRIPTKQCSEKYHLVDLIMEFAESHGIKSRDDIQNEVLHRNHIEQLRRKAENLRLQEQRMSEANSQSEGSNDAGHSSENETVHETEQSGLSPGSDSYNVQDSSYVDIGSIDNLASPQDIQSGSLDDGSSLSNERGTSNLSNSGSIHRNEQGNSEISGGGDSSHDIDTDTVYPNNSERNDLDMNDSQHDILSHDNADDVHIEGNGLHNNQTDQSLSANETESRSSYVSPRHQASGQWQSVEDISMVDEICHLSVLELKQVLTANFIDYRGCCEKKELVDKVTMLYLQRQSKDNDHDGKDDDRDLCKICMDKTIDCIFLDCAHLVACTNCGKQLSECPICRALIVRVIHIFRA